MKTQIPLFFLGVVAVWLSQSPNPEAVRYSCIFGLAAQPFWFLATYKAKQWGMLALSFAYTLAWARGFYVNWVGHVSA